MPVRAPSGLVAGRIVRVVGAGSAVLGLTAALGWLTRTEPLVLLGSGDAPLMFNAALGFLLVGIALLATWRRKSAPGAVAGTYALAIGGLTLAQYAFAFDLGIDELFVDSYIDAHSRYPGRMAVNSAACFLLLGVALVLQARRLEGRHVHLAEAVLGSTTAAIGAVAVFGHTIDLSSAYGWGGFAAMPPASAGAFVSVGAGVVALAWTQALDRRGRTPRWLPVPLGVGTFAGALMLSLAILAIHPSRRAGFVDAGTAAAALVVVGLLMAVLVGVLAHLAQKAAAQAREVASSEARFRSIVETTREWIWSTDADGGITYSNPAVESILGYSPQEIVGRDLASFVDAGDRDVFSKTIRVGAEEASGWSALLLRWSHKDGSTRVLESSAVPILSETGEAVGFRGADRDVTARREAEEERQRFFNLSIDLLCIADFSGYFKELNPAWEQTLGYTMEELMAEPFVSFVHPDDRQATIDETSKLAHGDHTLAFQNRYRCKDGTYKWLSWRAVPFEEDGLIYASARDVTELRAAEDARRKWELIFAQSSRGVALVRVDDDTLVAVNPAFARMHGRSASELVGTPIADTFVPEERAGYGEHSRRANEQGHYVYESMHVRGDGSRFPVETEAMVVRDLEGRPQYRASFFQDITVRRRNKEALELQTKELGRSNAELEQFAYIASHDLQEPLRKVASFCQLLQRRYGGQLDETADQYIAFAVDGAMRMKTLINDLLTYSRAGRKTAPLAPVDCRRALEQAIDNLELAIEESGAHISRSELPTVVGDEAQLVQLFQNLLANAIKFHGNERPQVNVGSEIVGGEVVVHVRDNGVGIDPEQADRVFMMFQRLEQVQRSGTGIGLALCKRIVERHEGRIWVESEPGSGSTFYVALPVSVRSDSDG